MSTYVLLCLLVVTVLLGSVVSLKCDYSRKCRCSLTRDGTLAADCSKRKLSDVPKFYRNVTIINLSKNKIHFFPQQDYLPTSLTRLDFSSNMLTKFKPGIFRGMFNLQYLNLDDNELDYTSKIYEMDVFENLTMLQTMTIKMNTQMGGRIKIDRYPEAIAELSSLTSLHLDGLDGALFTSAFRHLQKLQLLDLSGITGSGRCSIYNLPSNFFVYLPYLTSVNLAGCKLRQIELNTFTLLPMMQFLNLSHNTRLTFRVARNLTMDLQSTNITTLDISKIHCTYGVGTSIYIEDLKFLKNTSIRQIYANSNRLTYIESGLTYELPNTLEFLSLDDNRPTMGIFILQLDGLKGVKSFSGNRQYTSHSPTDVSNRFVNCFDWRAPPPSHDLKIPSFSTVKGKPWTKSKNGISQSYIQWKRQDQNRFVPAEIPSSSDLKDFPSARKNFAPVFYKGKTGSQSANNLEKSPSENVFREHVSVKHQGEERSMSTKHPPKFRNSWTSFLNQGNNQTLCNEVGIEIIFHLPPNMENAAFSNSDLKYSKIPCIHVSRTNKLKSLDFSDNGLQRWYGPIYNLDSLEHLDLSGNMCIDIGTKFFDGSPNIMSLKLRNNLLGFVLFNDSKGQIFENLKQLSKLDLSINKIEKLPRDVFASLKNLRILDLSSNEIFDLNIRIDHMKNLKMLDLSKNELSSLNKDFRKNITSIAKYGNLSIRLHGNRLQCNCDTLEFLEWISDNKQLFENFEDYECSLTNKTVLRFDTLDRVVSKMKTKCSSMFGLILGVSVTIALSISCLVCGLVYRFRWKLRYLYYMTKYRHNNPDIPACNTDSTDRYRYRAFVSYAEEDSDYVRSELLEHLEKRHGFKLCIHQRDFIPGKEIAENVTSCIHESYKFMVILSEHYLRSYWCMFEFNMARMESIFSRNESNMVFIVFYKNVPSRNLPLDILALIESRSYAEYLPEHPTNDILWDSLRKALR